MASLAAWRLAGNGVSWQGSFQKAVLADWVRWEVTGSSVGREVCWEVRQGLVVEHIEEGRKMEGLPAVPEDAHVPGNER